MEGDPRYWIPTPGRLVRFPTAFSPEFPEEGVLNSHGYLFHHFLPVPLLDEHIERLLEYGIRYKFNEPFSRHEDEQIRKNWRRFAEKYDLAYEDGSLYAGLKVTNEIQRFYRKQNDKLVRRGMWPSLCRKLENRSAVQVQRRMLLLFDPHYVGKPDLIPYFDIVDAFARMGEGTSVLDIAMDLKVPFLRLLGAMKQSREEWRRQGLNAENIVADPSLLDKYRMLPRDFRRFYNAVLLSSGIDEISLRRAIFAARSAWKKELRSRMTGFNWVPLIPKFGKLNEKTLKKTWWSLLKKTVKVFFAELEANVVGEDLELVSDSAQGDAWAIALDQTMPHSPITLPAMKIFCRVLSNCVTSAYHVLNIVNINRSKLASKLLKKCVISDVNIYDIKNCQFYGSVSRRIAQWNKALFNHIDFPLNVRDKLRIAERCFDDLIEIHGEGAQLSKFPVTKSLLSNNTIKWILDLCEGDWSPPKILQKYVTDRALIGVFSRNRGAERDEEREKRIFRQNVFGERENVSRSAAILSSQENLSVWSSCAGRSSDLPKKMKNFKKIEAPEAFSRPKGGGWNLTDDGENRRDFEDEEGNRAVTIRAALKEKRKDVKFKNIIEEPAISPVPPEATADETIVAGHMLSQTLSIGENNILGLSPIRRSHGGLVSSPNEERKKRKKEKKERRRREEEERRLEREPLATSTQQSQKRQRDPTPPPRAVSPVEEEEEEFNDDGDQFSHLLMTSSQPLPKRPRRSPPPSANNTMNSWLDLFS